MKTISIKYLILFLISISFFSCDKNNNSIIINKWEILYENYESLDMAKKSNKWKKISDVRIINLPFKKKDSYNSIWLKSNFIINVSPQYYYGISINNVNLLETIYLNDIFITSMSIDELGNLDQPRNNIIPQNVLKKGINEIYIHLTSYKKWTLGIGKVLIQDKNNFNKTKIIYNLFEDKIPFAILFILIGILISLIIKFVFHMDEKEHLYMALRLLVMIIFMISMYFPYRIFNLEIIFSFWYSMSSLMCIFFIMYYQSIYGIYLTKNNIVIVVTMIFLTIFFYFLPLIQNYDISPYLFVVIILFLLFYNLYLLLKLNKIKPDIFKFLYISIELSIIFIQCFSVSIFFITGYGGINDPSSIILIGIIIISINTIIYYSKKDSIRKKKLEILFEKIKKIDEKKNNLVTKSNEEKIKIAIEFINENYKENINRDDIAGVIGLNSNYLSSIFNDYTGKKINQYINDLRINEAKKLLKDTDKKIIDIAYDSGFDSLTTFNRIFKQTLKLSPSDYKTKNKL